MYKTIKLGLTALAIFSMVKGILLLNGVVDTTPPQGTEVQCEKD